MTEKIGLESIFGVENFQKGLDIYLKGLKDAEKATAKTAQSTSQVEGSAGGMTAALGSASGGLSLLSAAALGAAAAVGIAMVSAIGDAIRGLIDFGKESITTAARVEELTIVAQLLGQRAGFTAQQVEDETNAIRDLGIRTDVALKLVAQFSRYEIDLAQATELANVARNAAVISTQDTSDALDQLLYGVLTYNKRVLRTAGIMVNVRGGFEEYAASVDKATAELSEAEKIQSTLNKVIAEGARIEGLYVEVQETAAKQMRSLRRNVFDLSVALGAPFQAAFTTLISGFRNFIKLITAAVQAPKEVENELGELVTTGGELYDIFIKLGAAASIFADGLVWLGTAISKWVVGGFAELETVADNAFEWGLNIIVQLADGIITGALGVLTWAMNQITALLTYWLSGASPPRVAPDLPKWGANAMTEFLKGFTKADYGALKTIQRPLKSALALLVQTKGIGQKAAANFMVSFSTEMAKVLSGGKLDPKLFDNLAKSVGPFGVEIADLARKVLDLAYAEEKLNDARKREEKATKAVRDGIADYNRALRAGATEEALDTQLEYINAQEVQRQSAIEQRSEAEKQMDTLKEMVELQKQLVDQLISLSQVQVTADLAAAAKAGAEAGGALGAGLAGGLSGAFEGFTDKIKTAVEDMKSTLLTMLDPLTSKWTEEWQPMFEEFGRQWDLFEIKVLTVWYRLFGPERGIVPTMISKLDFSGLQESLTTLGDSFGGLVDSFATLFGIDTSGTEGFLDKFQAFMEDPQTISSFQEAVDLLADAINELADALENLSGWLTGDQVDIFSGHKAANVPVELEPEIKKGLKFTEILLPWVKDSEKGTSMWGRAFEQLKDILSPGDELSSAIDSSIKNQEEFQAALNVTTEERIAALYKSLNEDVPPAFETAEKASGNWMTHLTTVVGGGIVDFLSGEMADLEISFGSEGGLWKNIVSFKDTLLNELVTGIESVSSAVGTLVLRIIELNDAIANLDMTSLGAVTESSPAPMAVGLEHVQKEMKGLISALPKLSVDFSLPDEIDNLQNNLISLVSRLPELTANISMPQVAGAASPISMMTMPQMAAVPVMAGAQTQNIQLNFSAVINTNMDMTTFEDRVSRIVIDLLT